MILVSACLLGIECRYDGRSVRNDYLLALAHKAVFIPICPEQLGGLPTPRLPAEIVNGDGFDVLTGHAVVVDSQGKNVTAEFVKGADEVIKLATIMNIDMAIMKERSPSCGVTCVKRDHILVQGMGVTSARLTEQGIRVITSDKICEEYVRHYRHWK
ncbi:MAG TPA: DUF523 domain-containing protein [Deltaproteobacteria bacterium]|nr:DUF523 domain-containing protein [Deltaproteobacteria bacterium]